MVKYTTVTISMEIEQIDMLRNKNINISQYIRKLIDKEIKKGNL